MGRAPCCEKDNVKRGPWTPEEDAKLLACIAQHGTGSWRTLPKKAGLQRCGKSCRLRWTNYLRPDLKHGRFTDHEEKLIVNLHAALGSRWSLIAAQLPGRTDNDVKNYWNTRLKKKLSTAHHIVAGNAHHQAAAAAAAARAASLTSTPKNSILAGRPSANSSCHMRTAIVSNHDQCHDQSLKSNDHLQLKPDQAASLVSSTPAHEIQFAATTTTGQQIFHNNPHKEYNNSTSTSSQQQQQQQIIKSCSTSQNNNKTHDHVLTNYEMEPWSPSMASGSSCSSTSLMAAGAAGAADSTGLQKVLNSDVFLWDFSELSSIMN
ncbi:unnamed protein product [Sphagnum jensenii]|uniref:MYB transcription factor n=1 Tax=Sphagnum jensenii TaxID=128206 RepID=A0ABP1ADF8_9BRYO